MTFLALRQLHEDPRYQRLSRTAARALDHALVTWADGENRWQVKRKTWGDAIGVSPRTITRVICEAEKAGLLSRTPYLRPARTGQGASIFGLVLDLAQPRAFAPVTASDATRVDTNGSPCENGVTENRQGWTPVTPLARVDTDVTPKERVSNEKSSVGEKALATAQARGAEKAASNNGLSADELAGLALLNPKLADSLSKRKPLLGDEAYPNLLAGALHNGHATELEVEQALSAHRFVTERKGVAA